jgi:hypothetical protein
MRIDSSGNVGIGTSSTTSQKLSVLGADATNSVRFRASTGMLRFNPYQDATNGSVISTANAAEAANIPLTFSTSAYRFTIGASEVMAIDSSGNVGVGVTPSNLYTPGKVVQMVSGGVTLYGSSTTAILANNINLNVSGASLYQLTQAASSYQQDGGAHKWFTAPSGTAGTAISFTQAMTLESNGNVGIGAAPTAGYKFDVYNAANNAVLIRSASTSSASLELAANGNTPGAGGLNIQQNSSNNAVIYNGSAGYLSLGTSGVEAMRITSGGASANVGIGRVPTVKLDVNGGIAIGTLVVFGTGSYTVAASDYAIRVNGFATVTLPAAASFPGRILRFFTSGGGTTALTSASSNVVLQNTSTASTGIFGASATSKWCDLQSDGTYWYVTGGDFA